MAFPGGIGLIGFVLAVAAIGAAEEVRTLDPAGVFSDRYLQTIDQMLTQGSAALPRAIRAEIISRRNLRVPIEAQAKLLTADGMVIGVSVIARNIAENEHLEAQLRQAPKMESVGRLATGIAHDFNNLITATLSLRR